MCPDPVRSSPCQATPITPFDWPWTKSAWPCVLTSCRTSCPLGESEGKPAEVENGAVGGDGPEEEEEEEDRSKSTETPSDDEVGPGSHETVQLSVGRMLMKTDEFPAVRLQRWFDV